MTTPDERGYQPQVTLTPINPLPTTQLIQVSDPSGNPLPAASTRDAIPPRTNRPSGSEQKAALTAWEVIWFAGINFIGQIGHA